MIVGFDSDDTGIFGTPVRIPPAGAGSSGPWPVCSRRSPKRHSTIALRLRADSTTPQPTTRGSRRTSIPLLMAARGDARRLARPDGPALRRRELLRTIRRALHQGETPLATAKMRWLRRHKPLAYLKNQTLTILGALGMLFRLWTDPRTKPYRPVYAKYLAEDAPLGASAAICFSSPGSAFFTPTSRP